MTGVGAGARTGVETGVGTRTGVGRLTGLGARTGLGIGATGVLGDVGPTETKCEAKSISNDDIKLHSARKDFGTYFQRNSRIVPGHHHQQLTTEVGNLEVC